MGDSILLIIKNLSHNGKNEKHIDSPATGYFIIYMVIEHDCIQKSTIVKGACRSWSADNIFSTAVRAR